jgi:hypothetical protein
MASPYLAPPDVNGPPHQNPPFPGAPNTPPPIRPKRGVPLPLAIGGGIAAILISCFAGVGIGAAGSQGTTVKGTAATPAPDVRTVTETVAGSAPAAAAPVASTVTVTATPPAAAAPPAGAGATIEEGTYSVGVDIQPGTYRAVGAGSDCYWAITKSGTNGSDIIDNHLGGGNLTVTLKAGQDFTSNRCGTWTKTK